MTANRVPLSARQIVDKPLLKMLWWLAWILISVPGSFLAAMALSFPIWTMLGALGWAGAMGIVAAAIRLSHTAESIQGKTKTKWFVVVGLFAGCAAAAYELAWTISSSSAVSFLIFTFVFAFGAILLTGTISSRE